MKGSKIEWCDHTFNSWIGCTRVSPGCTNCYAEALNARMQWCVWGPTGGRQRTSAAYWKQPLSWNRASAEGFLRKAHATGVGEIICSKRPRVFCGSLCDWLDDQVSVEWLADLLDLIRRTPMLDWLLLTKRPENWRERLTTWRDAQLDAMSAPKLPRELYDWVTAWLQGAAPANVWIGAGGEDQQRADKRIPALLSIPARVRFLSCEPLLGPVQLGLTHPTDEVWPEQHADLKPYHDVNGEIFWRRGIDWVVCGGESGSAARPMHPAWARSLRDQCEVAGVPFLFKQWGEWAPAKAGSGVGTVCFAGLASEPDERIRRVGKKAAGRLLDGVVHDEFPEVLA